MPTAAVHRPTGRLRLQRPSRRGPLTPLRPQFQTTECGVGALRSILAHFGCDVSAAALRAVTGVSRHCMNARDIVTAARHFGLRTRASRCSPDDLGRLALPVIVHLGLIHFAVLEAIGPTEVRLNDPAAGRVLMPRGLFDDQFTGVALEFSPGPEFQPAARPAPLAATLRACAWPGLYWAVGAILAVIAAAAALLLLAVRLDGGRQAGWVGMAAAGSALLAVAFADLASARAAARGAMTVMRHLQRLPDAFFAYRLSDRLHGTVGSAATAARLLHRAVILDLATGLAAMVGAVALTLRAPLLGGTIWLALLVQAAVVLSLRGLPAGVDRTQRGFEADVSAPLAELLWQAVPLKFSGALDRFAIRALDRHAERWRRGLAGRVREALVERSGTLLLIGLATLAAGIGPAGAGTVLLVMAIAMAWNHALSA
ncbi:MAG: cysteine peptidase family C39 domain-containing protein, partial [Acetobacteraceae bacterium]